MTDVTLIECIDECRSLVQDTGNIRGGQKQTNLTFIELQNAVKCLDDIDQSRSWTTSSLWMPHLMVAYFQTLAKHTHDALMHEHEYFTDLMQVLALRSRHVEWTRKWFGAISDLEDETKQPASVLEVARLTCTLKFPVEAIAIESALRLINNCCSGDDDNNRSAFIKCDGIKMLLDLALHDTNLDLLVPTLYTICADHSVPSRVLLPPSAYLGGDTILQEDDADEQRPSLAVELLGASHRFTDDFTTFELLLSLQSKVNEPTQSLLSDLIELATRPALSGFEHIRNVEPFHNDSWCFRSKINDQEYDTISLATTLASSNIDHILPISRAVLNILSRQPARDALLRRQDDGLLILLTIACTHDDDDELLPDDKDEIVLIRKAFLKILYETSGSEAFLADEVRPPLFVTSCINRLESYIGVDNSGAAFWTAHRSSINHPSNFVAASACIILAQLVGSAHVTRDPLVNAKLFSILIPLLQVENRPDVLYPALTIVSRISRNPEQISPFVDHEGLQSIRRLLVQQGLGLIVPFETVTVYKTLVRSQPTIVEKLVELGDDQTSIIDDLFQLWTLTFEAGTKLEIAKFFLEVLRSILARSNAHERMPDSNSTTVNASIISIFQSLLFKSAKTIAELFAWTCLNAEPVSQRSHGWFGLAMLSTFSEAKAGILTTLDVDSNLRDAVLDLSQQEDSHGRGNLALMVSKSLEATEDGSETVRSDVTEELLRRVAGNLGIIGV